MNFLHPYLHAVQRFTRLRATAILTPAPGTESGRPAQDTAHFPGVGWLVGLTACAVFAAFAVLLPDSAYAPLVAAVASTAATLLLTGSIHESGLALVAGDKTLTMALLAKTALLALLAAQAPVAVLAALFAAHVLSRFLALWLVDGPAPGRGHIARSRMLLAAAWCVIPLALAVAAKGWAFAGVGAAAAALVVLGLRYHFLRRPGPIAEDCRGTAQQGCEIAFYLGAAVALR